MRPGKDRRTLGLFDNNPQPKLVHNDGLRWYQEEAVTSIFNSFKTNRSTMLVLATGLGKTQVFSAVARRWPKDRGRVLVLAHREELVDQARKRLEQMTGEYVEVEQGQLRSGKARIVVGSIQTVYRPDRLERLERNGGFGLVIPDECHHYVSKTYQIPLHRFADAKVLGVTATPDRADSLALGAIFDDVAYSMDLRDGIDHGYLVPLRGREVMLDEVNLDNVGLSAGDLAAGQLDDAFLAGCEGVVKGMLHFSGERQGVVFFPGVQTARMAAARFNALKPGCADSIDGETPSEVRKRIVSDFREGRIQFLTNCMVATEGFDAPTAAVIGLARPTKSRSLYAQMVGRGTRVLPGIVEAIDGKDRADERKEAIKASTKDSCLLIDFVGNNTRHTLMTPSDLLGGKYPDEVRQRAKKMVKEEEHAGKDVNELLEEAKEVLAKEELNRIARSAKSVVKSRSRKFDPFASLNIEREDENKFTAEYGFKPMTEKQVQFLLKKGFSLKELSGVSSRTASKMIGRVIERGQRGLATKPQLAMLSRHGITDNSMSAAIASTAIRYIKAAGNNIDGAVLRQIVSNEEF